MRKHHPPLAWMDAGLSFAGRERHSVGAALPERPGKICDHPEQRDQAYGPGYFSTDAQGDIGFAFVFLRGQLRVCEHSRQHGQIDSAAEQYFMRRRHRPTHPALVKTRHS